MELFDPTLLSPSNVKQIATALRVQTKGLFISLKVTRKRGVPEVLKDLVLFSDDEDIERGGIRAFLPDERGGSLTNSAQLGFVFKRYAFHFETNDNPVFERLSEKCFRITNRRLADEENPVVEVVFSIGAAY